MRRTVLGLLLMALLTPAAARAMDARPLLYSLLLPGLGEWSLGYEKRAIAHWSVEAGCWAGNFYYRDRGFELRKEYEAYAEAHWEEGRWAAAWNPDGQPEWLDWVSPDEWAAFAEYWDPAGGQDPATAIAFDETHEGYLQSHFAPYQEDPQHYYENLGKYDWYRWGWDDYDSGSDGSQHRYVYLDKRNASNDAFDRAHDFISVMLLARVVSLADTFLLLHRLESGASRQELDRAWRLELQPRDPREASFRLALTRRW